LAIFFLAFFFAFFFFAIVPSLVGTLFDNSFSTGAIIINMDTRCQLFSDPSAYFFITLDILFQNFSNCAAKIAVIVADP
jgi:hypothetical protein